MKEVQQHRGTNTKKKDLFLTQSIALTGIFYEEKNCFKMLSEKKSYPLCKEKSLHVYISVGLHVSGCAMIPTTTNQM